MSRGVWAPIVAGAVLATGGVIVLSRTMDRRSLAEPVFVPQPSPPRPVFPANGVNPPTAAELVFAPVDAVEASNRETFVDRVPPDRRETEPWDERAAAYRIALQGVYDYRTTIKLGRALGFLERWGDAAAVYERLFIDVPIADAKSNGRLDASVLKSKPELLYAYLECGVTEHMAWRVDKVENRAGRAIAIFQQVISTVPADAKDPFPWWSAKYHQILLLTELGRYSDAKLSMDDLTRHVGTAFTGDTYGYTPVFEALHTELEARSMIRKLPELRPK